MAKLDSAPHALPAVVYIHMGFRGRSIAPVHDETCNVPQAIDPTRIERKPIAVHLKSDFRCSLVMFAIEDDFLHALVILAVVDDGREELVRQASLESVGIAVFSAFIERANSTLNQVRTALPIIHPSLIGSDVNCECCVVGGLPLAVDAKQLKSDNVVSPVSGGRHLE
jgi:hypothetical protein